MKLPPLHVVTDDAVLADPDFHRTANDLLHEGGDRIALHLRGHDTSAARIYDLATTLAGARSPAWLLVNDRVDVALAAAADGVQLGRRSVPVRLAKGLVRNRMLGYSAHDTAEARKAVEDGADFVIAGTIWRSPSHPASPVAGPALIEAISNTCSAPVIAIGGLTVDRVAQAIGHGAAGVALLGGIWRATNPVLALRSYLEAIEGCAGMQASEMIDES